MAKIDTAMANAAKEAERKQAEKKVAQQLAAIELRHADHRELRFDPRGTQDVPTTDR